MKIGREIYSKILENMLPAPLETGGIIGGNNNIVTEFIFDAGSQGTDAEHYYPNTDKLNFYIAEWQKSGIEFYGIIHSHLQEEKELSSGDREYIQTIMLAMPKNISFLYFPIVLPQKEIIPFKAIRVVNKINIIKSNIKIINERV